MIPGLQALWAPRQTFERIRDAERPSWLVPTLLWVGVNTLCVGALMSRIDVEAELLEQMVKSLPEGQEAQAEQMTKMSGVIAGVTMGFAMAMPTIHLLFVTALAWLSTLVLNGRRELGRILTAVVHSHAPMLWAAVLGVIVVFLRSETLTLETIAALLRDHPAAFTSLEPKSVWFTLSAMFGVFSLWRLGLNIYGLSVALDIPLRKSALWWGGVRIAALLVGVGGAAAGAAQAAGG